MKSKNKNVGEGIKLIKHFVIIAILVVVGAAVAHFGLVLFTRHNARCTVPQFKGLILTEAEYIASAEGLNIIINDSLYAPMYEGGMVLDQLPKAGVDVKPGRTVYVTINAWGKKKVQVPYVAGRSLRQAKNMLEVAGLQIERLIYKSDMATNYVLAEYLGATQITQESKHQAVVGSGVILHVGMSQDEWSTRMPQLVGMTLSQAKSRLWESGLNVGRITLPDDVTELTVDKARVCSQSVWRGVDVTFGTNVSLELTLDNERVDKILDDIEKASRVEAKRQLQMEDSLSRERVRRLSQEREQQQSTTQSAADNVESTDSFFE
ncbi:MAG: PASTA domain-containing protein [Rikenellaceae bacterium]